MDLETSNPILSLAPEVINLIGEQSNLQDIKQSRLTCKYLSENLESFVLQTISFNINYQNLSTSISKVRSLALGESPGAARSTSQLVLKCFSPKYNPPVLDSKDGEWVQLDDPDPSDPEVVEAERKLKKYLFLALSSLKSVRYVSWTIHWKNSEWVQSTIMEALQQSFPGLERLEILGMDSIRCALPLHRLHNLKEIAVSNAYGRCKEVSVSDTYTNLGRMLPSSTQLTTLRVNRKNRMSDSWSVDPDASLHHLYSLLPLAADSQPLRLRELALNGMFVLLDKVTLPHFRNLISLDISHMLEPSLTRRDYYSDSEDSEPNYDLFDKQKLVGSSVNEFWKTLTREAIYLEEITMTCVMDAFLLYLSTYCGLKKLRITSTHNFRTAKTSDTSATQFFRTSLSNHVGSLEDLTIFPSYEGLWCFGDHNISILMQLTKLQRLGLAIDSRLLKDPDNKNDADKNGDTVVFLIDSVSCYLPLLQNLNIVSSIAEVFRGDWCGTEMTSDKCLIEEGMVKRLCNYAAPPSCKHLPVVVVGDVLDSDSGYTTFFPRRDSIAMERGEHRWKYEQEDAS